MIAGAELETANYGSPGEDRLVERILSGERELFHDLVRPHERTAYGVALSILRNTADAEEATQEAMLKAYTHLKQLQKRLRFRSWLLRIVANEAHMKIRRNRPDLFVSIDDDEEEEEGYQPKSFADWRDLPSEALDRAELRAAISVAINRLPDKYRSIFLLADVQQIPYEEIGEMLNLSRGAVKTRVHRARLKVQEQVKPAYTRGPGDILYMLKGMNPWSRAGK